MAVLREHLNRHAFLRIKIFTFCFSTVALNSIIWGTQFLGAGDMMLTQRPSCSHVNTSRLNLGRSVQLQKHGQLITSNLL